MITNTKNETERRLNRELKAYELVDYKNNNDKKK